MGADGGWTSVSLVIVVVFIYRARSMAAIITLVESLHRLICSPVHCWLLSGVQSPSGCTSAGGMRRNPFAAHVIAGKAKPSRACKFGTMLP